MNTPEKSDSRTQSVVLADEERRRARSTILSAAVVLVFALVNIIFYIYLSFQTGSSQAGLSIGTRVMLAVLAGSSIFATRRRSTTLGAWICLGSIVFGGLTIVLFDGANLGLWIGFTSLLAIFIISTQTLPERWINVGILVGIIVGITHSFLDLFAPIQNTTFPIVERFIPIMVVICVVIFTLILVFRFRYLSLRIKGLIVFMVVTIVVAGLVTVFTLNIAHQALKANVGVNLYRLADANARSIGNLLTSQIDSLSALSLGDQLQDWVYRSNANVDNPEVYMDRIKELDQVWREASAANNPEDLFVNSRLANPIALELEGFSDSFPENAELILTDRFGALLAANNLTSDFYQGDETWWQEAFNGGEGGMSISVPELNQSIGENAIIIAIPVRKRDTGEVIGVLRTTYLLSHLETFLDNVGLGDTGEADLYFGRWNNMDGNQVQHFHGGNLEVVDPEFLIELQGISDATYTEVSFEGVPSLVSIAPVQSASDDLSIKALEWDLLVHQDLDEAMTPVSDQTRSITLLVIVIIGCVSTAAIFLTQSITAPIVHLTKVAKRIHEGDLTAQATVRAGDEVGQLAVAFNQMTDQLRQTLAGLEQSVTDRTRELSLAGETGRALSQVRDLNDLLSSAVDLIQFSFDLYYAQVYMLDSTERVLVLRAGTGDVGAELLGLGHRLPVGMGSINGQAVVGKNAVIVSDTSTNPIFQPNPILPETRSEMAIPLVVGERVVGVLDLQSNQPGTFSEANLPAFEALAGQLAVAIENASLFEQAQQARFEMENHARRLTREGWREYLDAIERSERIGYICEQDRLEEYNEPLHSRDQDDVLAKPILVTEERVGTIQIQPQAGETWSSSDEDLVRMVAGQVAHQVENLRLLGQAESYRAEAEQAARRLTHEGWAEYFEGASASEAGFTYDQIQVEPLDGAQLDTGASKYDHPLRVRDEIVGELIIEKEGTLNEDDQEMIKRVAERLSEHLETLRLSTQMQRALGETQALYQGSAQVINSTSLQDILLAVVETTTLREMDQANIVFFDRPWGVERPNTMTIVAAWDKSGIVSSESVGLSFNAQEFALAGLFNPKEATVIEDILEEEGLDASVREIMTGLGVRSVVGFQLRSGGEWIGSLTGQSTTPLVLADEDVRRIKSLTEQAATVIQNQRLLEQSQIALGETQTLYDIIAEMNIAQTYDDILEALAEGTFLGRADQLLIMGVFDRPMNGAHKAEWIYPVAHQVRAGEDGKQSLEIAARYPLSAFEATPGTLFTDQPVILADLANDRRLDKITRTLFQEVFQAQSSIILPLMLADQSIGFIQGYFSQPTQPQEEDVRRLRAVASQAAVAVQSRLLLEQAQARARQEERIREVSTQVYSAPDVDTVMRRAVEQVGRVLGVQAYIHLGEGEGDNRNEVMDE